MSAADGWWFPAKRYGWGWGLPVSWQGWVVVIVWFAVFFAGLVMLLRLGLLFPWLLVWVLITSVLLTGICYLKGEPPRWRWGDHRP